LPVCRLVPQYELPLTKRSITIRLELSRHRSAGRLEFCGEQDMYGKAYVFQTRSGLGRLNRLRRVCRHKPVDHSADTL
jgi:hypothetical protein